MSVCFDRRFCPGSQALSSYSTQTSRYHRLRTNEWRTFTTRSVLDFPSFTSFTFTSRKKVCDRIRLSSTKFLWTWKKWKTIFTWCVSSKAKSMFQSTWPRMTIWQYMSPISSCSSFTIYIADFVTCGSIIFNSKSHCSSKTSVVSVSSLHSHRHLIILHRSHGKWREWDHWWWGSRLYSVTRAEHHSWRRQLDWCKLFPQVEASFRAWLKVTNAHKKLPEFSQCDSQVNCNQQRDL